MQKLPTKIAPTLFSLITYRLLLPSSIRAFSIADEFLLNTRGDGTTVQSEFPSFSDIISKSILPNALVLSGIILLFIFTFGGLTVITSANNPEQAQKGKQAITGAIIGFIVIFMAYWIIQIIEVITGIKILDPGF